MNKLVQLQDIVPNDKLRLVMSLIEMEKPVSLTWDKMKFIQLNFSSIQDKEPIRIEFEQPVKRKPKSQEIRERLRVSQN